MRSLDIFIFREMQEQYRRFNPVPNPDNVDRPTVDQSMESEMVLSLLTELEALRPRCYLYETRIVHLNQEKKDLLIKNAELERELKAVKAELAETKKRKG